MLPLDAFLKGIAAASCLTFAIAFATASRTRREPRALAALFLLVAINQAAETARVLASDPAQLRSWFRAASVAAALDPVALAYFAVVHPRSSFRPAEFWGVFAAGGALALFAGWGPVVEPGTAGEASWLFPVALSAFTFLAYARVLAWLVHELGERPDDRTLLAMLPGTIVVAVPLVGRVVEATIYWRDVESVLGATDIAIRGVALVAVFAAFLLVGWRVLRDPRRAVQREPAALGLALAAGIVLLGRVHEIVGAFGIVDVVGEPTAFHLLARADTPIRWLVIGALLSGAVFRQDALGLSVGARRTASRVVIALAAALLITLALGVVQATVGGSAGLGLPEVGIIALVLVLSQGFRRAVDALAWRLYGVPPRGDATVAHATYRDAVARAAGAGRLPARDPELQRLREDLGIDMATAELLEKLAERQLSGPLRVGQVAAGRYRVEAILGRGGGGRAFRAVDLVFGRDVVLKEVLHDGGHAGSDAVKEARAAGSVHHPSVVAVFDWIDLGGSSLLVTEYAPGGSLAARIEREGPYDADAGAALAERLLSGLAAVHDRRIVHGDIKPENVLLGADGSPKLADFGLAAGVTTVALAPSRVAGTPAYMAPEQLRGGRPSRESDVYAVALLMRRCIRPPLPPPLEAVVARAADPDPGARFAHAREMLEALQRARGEASGASGALQ